MFSATFLITYAEGLCDSKRRRLKDRLEADARAFGDAYVLGDTVTASTMNAGDLFFEVGFPDQDAYEAAKQTAEWADIREALADRAAVSLVDFAAYGDEQGTLKLTEPVNATGHRVLFMHVDERATEEKLAHVMEMQPYMQDFIPGFLNSKITKTVESEGHNTWDYVFECDFADPSVYSAAYLMHPIHITYIDRFFEPACKEFVFSPDLCTSVVETETAFLANYAE